MTSRHRETPLQRGFPASVRQAPHLPYRESGVTCRHLEWLNGAVPTVPRDEARPVFRDNDLPSRCHRCQTAVKTRKSPRGDTPGAFLYRPRFFFLPHPMAITSLLGHYPDPRADVRSVAVHEGVRVVCWERVDAGELDGLWSGETVLDVELPIIPPIKKLCSRWY